MDENRGQDVGMRHSRFSVNMELPAPPLLQDLSRLEPSTGRR